MSALRQRAAQLARQARTTRPTAVRNTRSYGSSHGHEEHGHNVEEPLGVGTRLFPEAAIGSYYGAAAGPGADWLE